MPDDVSEILFKVLDKVCRGETINWNRIVSQYFFWRYAYCIVRKFHDMITIWHMVKKYITIFSVIADVHAYNS